MKGGHFFPEENPGDTVAVIKQFLSAQAIHRKKTGQSSPPQRKSA
jgi:surfactin synthase thioesterase subunit